MRLSDLLEIKGLSNKASRYLSWHPEIQGADLVLKLVKDQMNVETHAKKFVTMLCMVAPALAGAGRNFLLNTNFPKKKCCLN